MAKHTSSTSFKCKIIRALTAFIGNVTGDVTGAITPPIYTTAELDADILLPVADNEGKIVRCSDGDTGSECLAYSDGTDWLRIVLGAAVAT